jgi:hypothetical protein
VLDGKHIARSAKRRVLAPGEMAELILPVETVQKLSAKTLTVRIEA